MHDSDNENSADWAVPGKPVELDFSTEAAGIVDAVRRMIDRVESAPRTPEQASAWGDLLINLTRAHAQLTGVLTVVASVADEVEVGCDVGARSALVWWANQSRLTYREATTQTKLGKALDRADFSATREALLSGEIVPDQASVIAQAVDDLPDKIGPEIRDQAQQALLGFAAEHDAKRLRILGRRILQIVAPEVADAHEQALLESEESKAARKAWLTMADDGQGSCHGRFLLPSAQGEMLRKQLLAIAYQQTREGDSGLADDGPSRDEDAGTVLTRRGLTAQHMGESFGEYIERFPEQGLPKAGGVNATVVVTISYDTLIGGLDSGLLDTGGVISAGYARRLACEAGIIPVVLGGKSEILDVGRKQRFHTKIQRIALGVRDKGCTADGCDMPPSMCHAHHDIEWSRGGPTSVDAGR